MCDARLQKFSESRLQAIGNIRSSHRAQCLTCDTAGATVNEYGRSNEFDERIPARCPCGKQAAHQASEHVARASRR